MNDERGYMATMTLNLPLHGGEMVEFKREDPAAASLKPRYKLKVTRTTKRWDKMTGEDVVTHEELEVNLDWEHAVDLMKGMDKLT
jgi:hypothetical protein